MAAVEATTNGRGREKTLNSVGRRYLKGEGSRTIQFRIEFG